MPNPGSRKTKGFLNQIKYLSLMLDKCLRPAMYLKQNKVPYLFVPLRPGPPESLKSEALETRSVCCSEECMA